MSIAVLGVLYTPEINK